MPTKRILVIESEEDFAETLAAAFSRFDAEVNVIADGKQGLQGAKADPPDLILLRVELPRMSGYSICNKLKKDKKLKAVPLIIMSSEATEETFEQHRKLKTRAEDYIIKPFDDSALLDKATALLELDEMAGDDEIITLDDDEAISLDDDEAITLDDDEAFSLDEIEDLGEVDEEIDLGEGDSTVVMTSPLEGRDDSLEQFDDVFDDLQVAEDAAEPEEDGGDDDADQALADFDDMLESLEEVQEEGADDAAGEADEDDDDLDLSLLEDLELPEDDAESAAAEDAAAEAEDDLLAGLEMDDVEEFEPAAAEAAPAEEEDIELPIEELESVPDPAAEEVPDIEVSPEVEEAVVDLEEEIPEIEALEELEPDAAPAAEPAAEQVKAGPDPVLTTKLANAEEDNQRLTDKVTKLEARMEEMRQDFEKRESELGSLRTKTTSKDKEFLALKSTINAKDREILEFKEEMNRKDQEILEVQEKMVERDEESSKVQEKLTDREREIKELNDQLDELRQAKNRLDEDLAAKTAEWEDRYTTDTAKLEHQLQTQAEEHETALADAKQEVADAKADVDKVRQELDDTVQRHNDEVFGLRARSKQAKEKLEEHIAGLDSELTELRGQYDQECSDHENTRAEAARVPDLTADLEETLAKNGDLEQQVVELQSAVAEHEDRVVQAYQKIKNDEKIKEKARKAVEIAFTLLADEVSNEGDGEDGEDGEEMDAGEEART